MSNLFTSIEQTVRYHNEQTLHNQFFGMLRKLTTSAMVTCFVKCRSVAECTLNLHVTRDRAYYYVTHNFQKTFNGFLVERHYEFKNSINSVLRNGMIRLLWNGRCWVIITDNIGCYKQHAKCKLM